MANIKFRKNKDGSTSATIRVFRGRDLSGKELKPYIRTVKFSADLTERQLRKAADDAARDFERDCKEGKIAAERPNFQSYAAYVFQLKQRTGKLKNCSANIWETALKRLDDEIGPLKLEDIRVDMLNKFYGRLMENGNQTTGKGLSPRTIRIIHGVFSSVMGEAVKEGLLQTNIASRVTLPKLNKDRVDALELNELEAVLKAAESEPTKWKVFINLLISTGLRRGEVLGLRWSRCDLKGNRLYIDTNLTYTPKTGCNLGTLKTGPAANRFISIPAHVSMMLAGWKKEQRRIQKGLGIENKLGLVFTQDGSGEPVNPSNVNTYFKRFCEKYNLPSFHAHMFRHSLASVLINSGMDIAAVSQRLGHSRLSTTLDVYGHILQGADLKVVEAVDELIYKQA